MTLVWILIACLTVAGAAVAQPPAAGDVLAGAVPGLLDELDVPGAAVVVVQGDEVLALAGFGTVDPHAGTPVDPARHVFRIGSVSKPLTASVVLLEARRHGVDLHADQRDRLARLPIEPPLAQPLTLHQLLTHTAGFNERLFGQHVASPLRLTDLGTYLQTHLPPRFIEPGRVIAYNDHHTVLAAWIAEQLSGAAFPRLAQQVLLAPLGMLASTFRQVDQPPDVAAGRVSAWGRDGSGWRAYPQDYVITTPGAGAFATAADMGRYLAALLSCAAPVFDEALCALQSARQAAHHPRLPGRTYGFAEGHHGDLRVLYKDGQASGFNARLLLVPERSLGMFVVHNRNILGAFGRFEPAARFNRSVTGALLDALLPLPDATGDPRPRPAAGSGQRIPGYLGDYRNVVAARHTWERVIGLFDDVHVTATGRGVDLGYGEFVEVAPGLLQWHEGGRHHVAFAGAGEATHLFIGSGAYERIPWYTASWFTPWYLAGTGLWFLGVVALGGRGGRGAARWLAPTAAGLLLGFLGALAAVLVAIDVQSLFSGPPPMLLAVLVLPPLGALALCAQGLSLAAAWRLRTPWRRALEIVGLLVAGTFLLWLDYWNLLGFRLG